MRYDFFCGAEAFSCEIGEEPLFGAVYPHQTHEDKIAVISDPTTSRDTLQGYDALVSNTPGCAIGIRTADCVPILLHDPEHNAVAAIHSGWRGTVKHIAAKTIDLMQSEFGTRSEALRAVIGPSICKDCFQVGEEVVSAFAEAGFPMPTIHTDRGPRGLKPMEGGHHIDLWAANEWMLTDKGVRRENIFTAKICTYENFDTFYSARHDGNLKDRRILNAIRVRK